MNYKSLYEKVMKIDPKVRFVTISTMIASKDIGVLYGAHRNN